MDYKQTSISGTSYQRCNRGAFNNPLGGTPGINFGEERVINTGTEVITQDAGSVVKMLSDP